MKKYTRISEIRTTNTKRHKIQHNYFMRKWCGNNGTDIWIQNVHHWY